MSRLSDLEGQLRALQGRKADLERQISIQQQRKEDVFEIKVSSASVSGDNYYNANFYLEKSSSRGKSGVKKNVHMNQVFGVMDEQRERYYDEDSDLNGADSCITKELADIDNKIADLKAQLSATNSDIASTQTAIVDEKRRLEEEARRAAEEARRRREEAAQRAAAYSTGRRK